VARPEAARFVAALCDAETEGLRPERYHRAALDEALRQLAAEGNEAEAWVPVELRLTSSFLTYATHLLGGQVSSPHVRGKTQAEGVEVGQVLEAALSSGQVVELLRGLSPGQEGFAKLRAALAHYRGLAAAGGWPVVPEGGTLKPGMRDARVAVLRQRLRVTGELATPLEERMLDLGAEGVGVAAVLEGVLQRAVRVEETVPVEPLPPPEEFYDAEVEAAVKAFQRRHGLKADGSVGKETLAALRVPVEERIAQLLVNLERWRQAPRDLGARYVLVNLPAFELEAVAASQPVLRMRVVIGAQDWQTPIFDDAVEYLELNPEWHVPDGILTKEVLPKLQEDAGAAARLGLQVVERATGAIVDPTSVDWSTQEEGALPYRFAQAPGASNPLGRVKFMFPNRYAVYLHDTPSRAAFEETSRAFSHGCVRVEEPLSLAAFLLQGHEGWTADTLAAALDGKTPRRVVLPQPVPVHLLYWTAFVDGEGTVNFRPDIYRRDGAVRRALALEKVKVPAVGEGPPACTQARG
jgi:murein L,D-transpeptidase YcbB/YkuD